MCRRCRAVSTPGVGRTLVAGVVAGATGATALNAVTYLDMMLRGRPSSDVPTEVASRLADRVGLPLGDETVAPNRASALGALLGIVTGVGVGVGCAFLRRALPGPAALLPAACATGLAAMAGSTLPPVATGASDPRQWGVSGWLSDIVPHFAYGLVAVTTVDAVLRDR